MRRVTTLIALALLASGVSAQGEAEKVFYRAFYLENAVRDFEGAAKAYREAIAAAQEAKNDKLHLRALMQLGHCLQNLGQQVAAAEQFKRALQLDPENADAKAALSAPTAGQDELARHINALILRLGGTGREQAEKDLHLLGSVAVVHLSSALRSKQVGIVSGAARVLAKSCGAAGAAALVRALGDKKVIFPVQLVSSFPRPRTVAMTEVYDAALRHPDANTRLQVATEIVKGGWEGDPAVDAAFARLMTTVGSIEDPRPLEHILTMLRVTPSGWVALADRLTRELTSGDLERQLRALRSVGPTQDRVQMPAAYLDAAAEASAAVLAQVTDVMKRRDAHAYLKGIDRPWSKRTQELLIRAARHAFNDPAKYSRTDPRLQAWSSAHASAIDLATRFALMDEACAPDSMLTEGNKSTFCRSTSTWIWRAAKEGEGPELFRRGLQTLKTPTATYCWIDMTWKSDKLKEFEPYLDAADSPHVQARMWAYGILMNWPQPPAGSRTPRHLLSDLSSAEPNVRSTAWQIASRFSDSALAPGIRAYVKHLKVKERAWPLDVLAQLIGKDAVPDLRVHLAERFSANLIRQLHRILGEGAADDIVAAANRHGSGQVFMALSGDDAAKTVTAVIKRLDVERIDRQALTVAARAMPDAAFRSLILNVLRNGSTRGKAHACTHAGIKRMADAWPVLMQLLEHEDGNVRNNAKKAIEEIRWFNEVKGGLSATARADSLEKARALAKSTDAAKRRGAAFALAALGDAVAVPTLLELLEDREASVREAAVEALRSLGRSSKK